MLPSRLTVWLFVAGLVLWVVGLFAPLVPVVIPADRLEAFPWLASAVVACRWLVFGFDAGILMLFLLDAAQCATGA